jgi:hypothetical protein
MDVDHLIINVLVLFDRLIGGPFDLQNDKYGILNLTQDETNIK